MGLYHAEPASRLSVVRLTVAAINALVGVLFLRRTRGLGRTPVSLVAAAIPAFVVGAWAVRTAPPPEMWPLHAQGLFAAAGAAVGASLLSLGRSFAILPALRQVRTGGPYRLVRHPAYAAEVALVAACGLATPGINGVWPFLLAAPLQALRICAEERVLDASPEYREYRRAVRWRLVPGLW